MELPTLYIRDSKGKEREWSVTTNGSDVIVSHGLVGGKITQKVTKAKAKNVGKANETTPEEQAILEAKSKWTHQKEREDYHEDINEAGHQLRPMLALDATKVGHRIQWEDALAQPKLDGLRLTVGTRDTRRGFVADDFEMLTRKGEVYHVPHLIEPCHDLMKEVSKLVGDRYIALDGEAYIHGMPLQQITSLARKYQEGKTEQLEFHLFDLVIPNMVFLNRHAVLREALNSVNYESFKLVECTSIRTPSEMKQLHGEYVVSGYEGLMVRHAHSEYAVAQRSANLFKYKEFETKECKIVDMWEDKNGNAMLTCYWNHEDPSTEFDLTPKRTHDFRKEMLNMRDDFVGKWITVKYQALTNDGLPQFPVGLDLRECDDNGNPLV